MFFSDGPSILAYDRAGNQITFALGEYVATTTQSGSTRASTITLTRSQSDISKIVYGGAGGSATPVAITYSVAEPATVGMLLLGIAGVVVASSRGLDVVSVTGWVVVGSAAHEAPVLGHRLHPAGRPCGVPGNLDTLVAVAGDRGRLARRFCPRRDA